MSYLRHPGLWFLIGSLEMLFLLLLAELFYPGYSVSDNVISDLGVGPSPSREIFTAAALLFGLMTVIGAVLLRTRAGSSFLWLTMMVSGVGAIGVGLFNEHVTGVHGAFALLAFLFGNISAIYSYSFVHRRFAMVFVMLGSIGLVALVLLASSTYLGLGQGGMERMIFYPGVFWSMSFGVFLLANEKS